MGCGGGVVVCGGGGGGGVVLLKSADLVPFPGILGSQKREHQNNPSDCCNYELADGKALS